MPYDVVLSPGSPSHHFEMTFPGSAATRCWSYRCCSCWCLVWLWPSLSTCPCSAPCASLRASAWQGSSSHYMSSVSLSGFFTIQCKMKWRVLAIIWTAAIYRCSWSFHQVCKCFSSSGWGICRYMGVGLQLCIVFRKFILKNIFRSRRCEKCPWVGWLYYCLVFFCFFLAETWRKMVTVQL